MSEAKVVDLAPTGQRAEIKYPIYRKYNGGSEIIKIVSENSLIQVINYDSYWMIAFDTNSEQIAKLQTDPISVPSNRDEFEKFYGEAQWVLTKLNTVQ